MNKTCADIAAKLAEAEDALHKLLLGHGVQTIRSGERVLTYSDANLSELQRYIEGLRAALDDCLGLRSRRKRRIEFIPEG